MRAFASIHTNSPNSQSHNEAIYKGYSRVPVDCEIGALYIRILFPEVEADSDLLMTHIAIGAEESGDGEVFLSLSCQPNIPLRIMQPGKVPNVIVTYPETLAKSARIAHQMVALGMLKTVDIEPQFFEQINDHLQAHDIPILKVVRGASAGWKAKMNQMPSFQFMN